jgi:hypothetical protein
MPDLVAGNINAPKAADLIRGRAPLPAAAQGRGRPARSGPEARGPAAQRAQDR